MDPIQATAAHYASNAHRSAKSDIDTFYSDNALEGLYAVRRTLGQIAKMIRALGGRLAGPEREGPRFASAPQRA